jgi:hypothetical protein
MCWVTIFNPEQVLKIQASAKYGLSKSLDLLGALSNVYVTSKVAHADRREPTCQHMPAILRSTYFTFRSLQPAVVTHCILIATNLPTPKGWTA